MRDLQKTGVKDEMCMMKSGLSSEKRELDEECYCEREVERVCCEASVEDG